MKLIMVPAGTDKTGEAKSV